MGRGHRNSDGDPSRNPLEPSEVPGLLTKTLTHGPTPGKGMRGGDGNTDDLDPINLDMKGLKVPVSGKHDLGHGGSD